jgi:E3 ubiquitin-protein ligase ZNF598
MLTDNPVKQFEEFTEVDIVRTDDNLGIKYEREDIFEDNVILLRYNCPDRECDVACLGWPDLHRHVKAIHGKVMW